MPGRSIWIVVTCLWSGAVVLSTLQIYLREVARGLRTPWAEVLAANALAWLPWLAIAPTAIWLERRFPVPGSRTRRHLLIHIGAATLLSALFLVYLGYFHAAYLDARSLFPPWEMFRAELTEKLGQHSLVAIMLYVAILLGSFGYRTWSASRGLSVAQPSSSNPPSGAPAHLIVRSVGEVQRINPLDVDWIEGCGNYARLHIGDRTALIRRTLASLVDELGAAGFVRIHRSAIVNANRVEKLQPASHGDADIELASGHRIKVSRTYRRALEKRVL